MSSSSLPTRPVRSRSRAPLRGNARAVYGGHPSLRSASPTPARARRGETRAARYAATPANVPPSRLTSRSAPLDDPSRGVLRSRPVGASLATHAGSGTGRPSHLATSPRSALRTRARTAPLRTLLASSRLGVVWFSTAFPTDTDSASRVCYANRRFPRLPQESRLSHRGSRSRASRAVYGGQLLLRSASPTPAQAGRGETRTLLACARNVRGCALWRAAVVTLRSSSNKPTRRPEVPRSRMPAYPPRGVTFRSSLASAMPRRSALPRPALTLNPHSFLASSRLGFVTNPDSMLPHRFGELAGDARSPSLCSSIRYRFDRPSPCSVVP